MSLAGRVLSVKFQDVSYLEWLQCVDERTLISPVRSPVGVKLYVMLPKFLLRNFKAT